MTKTLLRPATIEDIPQIARVFRQARAEAMPWLPVLHTPQEDLAFFARYVLPNNTIELIEKERTVLGFAAFGDGWLNHLYVAPAAWRMGVGTTLLDSAFRDTQTLQLWVFERNTRAQAFYLRHGFTICERTDGSNNEERCPDLRMVWAKGPPPT